MPEKYKQIGMTDEEFKQSPSWVQKHYKHYGDLPKTYVKEWQGVRRRAQIIGAQKPAPTAQDSTRYQVTDKYGNIVPGKTVIYKKGSAGEQTHISREAEKEPKAKPKPSKPTEAEIKRQMLAKRTPTEIEQDIIEENIKRLGSIKTIRGKYTADEDVVFPEQLEMIDAQILGITQNIYDATQNIKKFKFLSTKQAKDIKTLYNAIDGQLRSGVPPELIEAHLKKEYGITIKDLSVTYKKSQ